MTHDLSMTSENLVALDIRRGPDSSGAVEWYRAMRARYRGEMTSEAVDEAEARLREVHAKLSRAFEAQKSSTSQLRIRGDRFLEHV